MVTLVRRRRGADTVEAAEPQLPAAPAYPTMVTSAVSLVVQRGYTMLAPLPPGSHAPGKMGPVFLDIIEEDSSHAVANRAVAAMGYPTIYIPLRMGPQRVPIEVGLLDWWLLELPALNALAGWLPSLGHRHVCVYQNSELRDEIRAAPQHFFEPDRLTELLLWQRDHGM